MVSDLLVPPFSMLTAAVNDAGGAAGEYFDASEVVHGFELSPAARHPSRSPATGAKPPGPGAQGTRPAHRRAAALSIPLRGTDLGVALPEPVQSGPGHPRPHRAGWSATR